MKRLLTAVVTAITILAASVVFAAPASAYISQQYCFLGEMCLYYNSQSYGYGAEWGTNSDTPSLNPSRNGGITYEFIAGQSGSAGAGQSVWNNAGAATNNGNGFNMQVCQNSNYGGVCEIIPQYYQNDLGPTHNNDTSLRWV